MVIVIVANKLLYTIASLDEVVFTYCDIKKQ